MRIALFGGSFDPPHRGHLAIARAAADRFALDQVLFAPTGLQPLKPAGAIAPFADRLAMAELLCQEDARFQVSTLEGPRSDGQPNFMIDTLRSLRSQLPLEAQLYSIVGADSFLDLPRWRSPDALLEVANWIVVSRPGFSLANLAPLALTPQQLQHVLLLEDIADPTSATAIRSCLHADKDCSAMLTAPVLACIRSRHLYTAESPSR